MRALKDIFLSIKLFFLTSLMYCTLYASDITLNDAIQMALKQNQNLILSSYNPKLQKNEIRRAYSVFDPQLTSSYVHSDSKTALQLESEVDTFSTGISKYTPFGSKVSLNYAQNSNGTNPPLSLSSATPHYTSSLGVGISQNLLKDFGESINMTKISVASRMHKSSQYVFFKEILNTLYDVQVAYWDLYEAQKNYELEMYGLWLIEELLKQKERMVELGGFPKALLQEIVASRADSMASVAVTQKKLNLAEINFMSILGLQEGAFQTIDTPKEYVIENFNNDEYFINQHPDILVNKIEIENYTQLVKYYDNQNLPSLSLTANYAFHNPNANEKHLSPYSNEHNFYSSGVVFSMPLDDSNAKADIEKNRLNILVAKSKRDKLYHDIGVSIKKAKNEVETIKNITNLSKISVNAQEEIMKNEDRKLELGLTTMKNYLDNLNALITKKKKLLTYECDMMRSFAGYYRAVGSTPEYLHIDLSELK